jgi:hypothetical protein
MSTLPEDALTDSSPSTVNVLATVPELIVFVKLKLFPLKVSDTSWELAPDVLRSDEKRDCKLDPYVWTSST